MRVLLDEQLPRQLAPYLVGHEVRTVQQQGWAGLKNGDQNLRNSALFIVVLVAVSNAIEDLLPVVPSALAAMVEPNAGQVLRVSALA